MKTVRIDSTKCRGYGWCVELSRNHFSTDDWGFVQTRGREVLDDELPVVQSAIDACPFNAIRWMEGVEPAAIAQDP